MDDAPDFSQHVIASRVLADMSDGVMTIDLQGTIITFNQAASRILGISPEEAAAKSFGEVFFLLESNDAFNQAILDAVYDSSTTHNQIVAFHNAGRTLTLSLTTTFLQSEENGVNHRIGVIVVFSDITEMRALQEAETRMAEELKAKHKELQDAFRVTEAGAAQLAEAVRKIQVTRYMAVAFTLLLCVAIGGFYLARGHGVSGKSFLSELFSKPAAAPLPAPGPGSAGAWHTVAPQPVSSSIALTGRLQPLQLVNVNSPLTGKVEKVSFQYGDMVSAGQVLLVMDVGEAQVKYREAKTAYIKATDNLRQLKDWENGGDVARARRSLTKAKLSLEAQKKTMDETERLFKQGIIPANEYESVKQQTVSQQLDYQSAEEELKAAASKGNAEGQQIARFELENAQVRLQQVEAELAHATVRAPVSGIVVKPASSGAGGGGGKGKTAERGETFQNGEILLAIGDLTAYSVVSKVDEVDVTKVKQGQKIVVTGDAFQGVRLEGVIRSISPQAEDGGGGRGTPAFSVNMAIDALTTEQRQRILVGMSANVEILVYQKPDALMVPVSAVLSENGKRYVMRKTAAEAAGKAPSERVEVQTGYTTLDAVEITQGLKAGDVVETLAGFSGAVGSPGAGPAAPGAASADK